MLAAYQWGLSGWLWKKWCLARDYRNGVCAEGKAAAWNLPCGGGGRRGRFLPCLQHKGGQMHRPWACDGIADSFLYSAGNECVSLKNSSVGCRHLSGNRGMVWFLNLWNGIQYHCKKCGCETGGCLYQNHWCRMEASGYRRSACGFSQGCFTKIWFPAAWGGLRLYAEGTDLCNQIDEALAAWRWPLW